MEAKPVEDKKFFTGHLGALSVQQEDILKVIVDYVKTHHGRTEKFYDDWYMSRFCRARNWEVTKIKLMVDNFFVLREKYGIDTILQED